MLTKQTYVWTPLLFCHSVWFTPDFSLFYSDEDKVEESLENLFEDRNRRVKIEEEVLNYLLSS